MRRIGSAIVLLMTLVALTTAAGAAPRRSSPTVSTTPPPVVAVIDSGVRATHQEFDYRGRLSGADQIVAWWDFTSEVKPAIVVPKAGQVWDTTVADPYDREGHGTLTASLVGGRGLDARKTPAALRGAKLAIAKVANANGSIQGDVAAAINWAVTTVRADVITMSINSIVPVPASPQRAVYKAITAARQAGVLVVVSNGNGYAGAGLPGDPGWANSYSSSTAALTVGAAGSAGYSMSTDPEVTATYTSTGASHLDDRSYVSRSGTSFGTPFVAGLAASLIKAAREAGRTLGVEQLEKLIKFSASDTAVPPTFEGYGVVDMAGLAAAQSHARAGTLPARPTPDLSGAYVESYAGTLRSAWSD